MLNKLRINALVVSGLGVLFFAFFNVSKHLPALARVNPFAEDPFDAIGSFGVQAAALLTLLGLARAFRPYGGGCLPEEEGALVARTQMLAVLAAAVTLAGDLVAMARYGSLWIGSAGGYALAALLGGLLVLALLAAARVYQSAREMSTEGVPRRWQGAMVISLAAALVLALYPDSWRQSTPGALLTVVVGAALLFALMRAWGSSLVPYPAQVKREEATTLPAWLRQHGLALAAVVVAGILLGLTLVLAESTEGGGWPGMARLTLVAAVYVGLETAGLLLGYVFLRKPLGLP
jgi:hypothetical protein